MSVYITGIITRFLRMCCRAYNDEEFRTVTIKLQTWDEWNLLAVRASPLLSALANWCSFPLAHSGTETCAPCHDIMWEKRNNSFNPDLQFLHRRLLGTIPRLTAGTRELFLSPVRVDLVHHLHHSSRQTQGLRCYGNNVVKSSTYQRCNGHVTMNRKGCGVYTTSTIDESTSWK